jgi:putative transposase
MPQSLVQIYLHLVFSTKNRARFFQNRTIRQTAHAYLAGACRNLDCPALIVGGAEDHVHILCRLGKIISVQHRIRRALRLGLACLV